MGGLGGLAGALGGGSDRKPNADEEDKYVINVKQIAKFVVGLGDKVASSDIEEGMRVGYVSTRYFPGYCLQNS
jgi:26S proteasome regulatory subunit T1